MSIDDKLDLEQEIHDLFVAKLKEFQAYCTEMQINERERKEEWAEHFSDEYTNGYNAGLTDGVSTALSLWTEENGFTY